MNKISIICLLISTFLLGVFLLKEHFKNGGSNNQGKFNIYFYNFLKDLPNDNDTAHDELIKELQLSILDGLKKIMGNMDDISNWKNMKFTIYPTHIKVTLRLKLVSKNFDTISGLIDILKSEIPYMSFVVNGTKLTPYFSDKDADANVDGEVLDSEMTSDNIFDNNNLDIMNNNMNTTQNMNDMNMNTTQNMNDMNMDMNMNTTQNMNDMNMDMNMNTTKYDINDMNTTKYDINNMNRVNNLNLNNKNNRNNEDDWESELDGWNIVQSNNKPLPMSDINQSYIKGVASIFAPEIKITRA